MRHQKSGRRFNRDTNARKALMRNLCTSLLESGRITTTEAKAKELRRWVERLITTAKDQDLGARRRVAEDASNPEGGQGRGGGGRELRVRGAHHDTAVGGGAECPAAGRRGRAER